MMHILHDCYNDSINLQSIHLEAQHTRVNDDGHYDNDDEDGCVL